MITGTYSDGKTSSEVGARLDLNADDEIVITREENQALIYRAPRFSVDIHSRLGNTPRTVSLPDGGRFLTSDNDGLDELLKNAGLMTSVIHSIESHLTAVIAATVITVALLGFYLASGLPATAKLVADVLPQTFVNDLGEGSLEVLDRTWLDPSTMDADAQEEVRRLLQPYLVAHDALAPNLVFRRGIGPNALALPDGTIVLTDEIIELFETDEEIIAVTLHELGHLKHRHLLRRVVQDSILTIGLILIIGDIEVADTVLGLPALALEMSYSRDLEIEADHYALSAMREAGLDVAAFASMMTRLKDYYDKGQVIEGDEAEDSDSLLQNPLDSISTYLSTHPLTEDRIRLVDEYR